MSSEYDEIEFNLWVENLTDQIAKMDPLTKETIPNIPELTSALYVIKAQLMEVQRLKPKKKTDYDYKPAIPLIVRAKMLINAAENLIPAQPTPEQPQHQGNNYARRIPEIHITKFSGDITKYASFIASFHMKYDNLPIPDSERLQHLKECCIGDASKLIERYDLKDAHYQRALDKLEEAFKSKEDTISALYAKLKAVPIASNNNASLLANFYEIDSLLGALEANGQDLDAFPPLRDEVYYKYPGWLIHQACGKQRLLVTQFQKEVGEHIKIRMGIQANAPNAPKEKNPATMSALTSSKTAKSKKSPDENINKTPPTTSTPPKRDPTCVFCDNKHFSAECPSYVLLKDRKTKLANRCTICLSNNHATSQCEREIRCYYCKKVGEHHSCLCPQQFEKPVITPPPLNQDTSGSGTGSGRTTAFVQRHNGAHCTAIVTVVNPQNNRKFYVRTLFDNGSNESYIAETAARRIGLQLSPEMLSYR